MSNHIDFYFDIISPYAYIAHKKILKQKNNFFNYKPIFLGGLHNLAGIAAPAFNKYKMKNMINDCNLVSKKKFNLYFVIVFCKFKLTPSYECVFTMNGLILLKLEYVFLFISPSITN